MDMSICDMTVTVMHVITGKTARRRKATVALLSKQKDKELVTCVPLKFGPDSYVNYAPT